MKKDELLAVKVDRIQRTKVELAAEIEGLSLSEFLRGTAIREAEDVIAGGREDRVEAEETGAGVDGS